MPTHSLAAESRVGTDGGSGAVPTVDSPAHALLRECFALFHSTSTGLAKLSIETSNDLFEMDSTVTTEDVVEFKSKRREWLQKFDAALRDSFEARLAGKRRKGRRPDPMQSLSSLRVMNDADTEQQSALAGAAKRIAAAAKPELGALDYRVAHLFDEPPGGETDNPFAPAYLLDAIGMTLRSLYAEPRIWRSVMERVVGDFVPAIGKVYVQLNRFLVERGVLPEIGAVLRARSDLRPADDRQLVPLLGRLINEVHPSMQAWRSLDPSSASVAGYQLAPLAANPYAVAATIVPRRSTVGSRSFPKLDAMMASGSLAPVLEALDRWQRSDPMVEYLRASAPAGIDAGVTPVNRIPWIHAATAAQVSTENGRTIMDVIGFLFNYMFDDPSLPPRFRMIFSGLQVPILKVALADPDYFADKKHPARQMIDELAGAAIGADDDANYGTALETVARSIVDTICSEYVLDTAAFDRARQTLGNFIADGDRRLSLAMQPHIDASLEAETRTADRSQVRALIRNKLVGVDIPFDVRAFVGTVWSDYLTLLRQFDGAGSESYHAADRTIDDLLWSIAVKERTGQRARLSKLIPPLVRSLQAGGAAVNVDDERMERFLNTLYELHIEAIKPDAGRPAGNASASSFAGPSSLVGKHNRNLHDFVADMVVGTWLVFDREGKRVHARLNWISPLRAIYIFTDRSGSQVMVLTPEELAWDVCTGKATLVLEPVPLFDRAVSITMEYLAGLKAKWDAERQGTAEKRPLPRADYPLGAAA